MFNIQSACNELGQQPSLLAPTGVLGVSCSESKLMGGYKGEIFNVTRQARENY